jgi:hypothetical protein
MPQENQIPPQEVIAMKCIRFGLLTLLSMATCGVGPLMSAPQAGAPKTQSGSISDSTWRGGIGDAAKGNDPAELRIILQNGSLIGLLKTSEYEETLSITLSAPPGIRMKGTSVRDLKREGRNFTLDTFTGELSPDGRQIRGAAVDTAGTRSRWDFARVK